MVGICVREARMYRGRELPVSPYCEVTRRHRKEREFPASNTAISCYQYAVLTLIDPTIIRRSQRNDPPRITTLEILYVRQVLIHLCHLYRTGHLRRVDPRFRSLE